METHWRAERRRNGTSELTARLGEAPPPSQRTQSQEGRKEETQSLRGHGGHGGFWKTCRVTEVLPWRNTEEAQQDPDPRRPYRASEAPPPFGFWEDQRRESVCSTSSDALVPGLLSPTPLSLLCCCCCCSEQVAWCSAALKLCTAQNYDVIIWVISWIQRELLLETGWYDVTNKVNFPPRRSWVTAMNKRSWRTVPSGTFWYRPVPSPPFLPGDKLDSTHTFIKKTSVV